ncbi:MAG: hypothetical protein IJI25_12230 [Eubacterium sp.]|nr:hypothetical protein [Eubacterium sp.]
MKKHLFDQDELMAIAVFRENTLKETLDSMETALGILEMQEDVDMYALLLSAFGRLHAFTEEDFANLDLDEYLIPEEETENEGE